MPNATRLVLSIDQDETGGYANGTFLSRTWDFNQQATSYRKEGTTRFVNLDQVWYGIVTIKEGNGTDDYYNTIEYVPELNPQLDGLHSDFKNPFVMFNEWMKENNGKLNQIVENRFYGNSFFVGINPEELG